MRIGKDIGEIEDAATLAQMKVLEALKKLFHDGMSFVNLMV